MLEKILDYLTSIPNADFLKALGLLILSTCTGFVPNNNDLATAAAALVSQKKMLNPTSMAFFCFGVWSLGESCIFLTGKYLGTRLFKLAWVRKKITENKQMALTKMLNENLWTLIFTVRISPVFRAHTIMSLGALGLSAKNFLTKHIPVLFVHVMVIFHLFYYLGTLFKTVLADYATFFMLVIFLLWLSMVIWVGLKFKTKLNQIEEEHL